MKKTFLLTISLGVIALMAGCKKDNYKAMDSILSGRVLYQNLPVEVRSNGVQLELWQSGFELFTKIAVHVNQDGTFAASLFNGDYKLTRLRGNGPWADNTDTINVRVNGNTTVDVPVDPYFVIKSATFTRSGNDINASITIQRVNTTKALELVRLYIGPTYVTDQNNNAASNQKLAAAITDLNQPVTLTATIPAALVSSKDYVYVRAGVKTLGVAELVYSASQKIMLK